MNKSIDLVSPYKVVMTNVLENSRYGARFQFQEKVKGLAILYLGNTKTQSRNLQGEGCVCGDVPYDCF